MSISNVQFQSVVSAHAAQTTLDDAMTTFVKENLNANKDATIADLGKHLVGQMVGDIFAGNKADAPKGAEATAVEAHKNAQETAMTSLQTKVYNTANNNTRTGLSFVFHKVIGSFVQAVLWVIGCTSYQGARAAMMQVAKEHGKETKAAVDANEDKKIEASPAEKFSISGDSADKELTHIIAALASAKTAFAAEKAAIAKAAKEAK